MPKRIYYPYEAFREDLKELTSSIDKRFDAVIGIARGGMLLAQMLGEYYNMRQVFIVNTIGYKEQQKLNSVEIFSLPNLHGVKSALVVDDIVDSGDTMRVVIDTLQRNYKDTTFFTAALFYKPTASFKPNWYSKNPKGWIDFFWSEDLKE